MSMSFSRIQYLHEAKEGRFPLKYPESMYSGYTQTRTTVPGWSCAVSKEEAKELYCHYRDIIDRESEKYPSFSQLLVQKRCLEAQVDSCDKQLANVRRQNDELRAKADSMQTYKLARQVEKLQSENVELASKVDETEKKLSETEARKKELESSDNEKSLNITRVAMSALQAENSVLRREVDDKEKFIDKVVSSNKRMRNETGEHIVKDCSVCYEPLKKPHASECGHVLCQTCWSKSASCPHCRRPRGKQIKLHFN